MAGAVLLLALALLAALLIPPYYANWEFRRYLQGESREAARSHDSDDLIKALVVDRAASLGLPMRLGDVRVSRARNSLRIEALYVVRVDLPAYSVDLHFRPSN